MLYNLPQYMVSSLFPRGKEELLGGEGCKSVRCMRLGLQRFERGGSPEQS